MSAKGNRQPARGYQHAAQQMFGTHADKRNVKKLICAGITMLPCLLIGASAEGYGDTTQTVIMINNTRRYVQYEFTDDNDHTVVWPGNNSAFGLPPHQSETRSLNCNEGQKICYGAWVRGDDSQYWGAGNNNSENCDDCCFQCEGDTVRYNLSE